MEEDGWMVIVKGGRKRLSSSGAPSSASSSYPPPRPPSHGSEDREDKEKPPVARSLRMDVKLPVPNKSNNVSAPTQPRPSIAPRAPPPAAASRRPPALPAAPLTPRSIDASAQASPRPNGLSLAAAVSLLGSSWQAESVTSASSIPQSPGTPVNFARSLADLLRSATHVYSLCEADATGRGFIMAKQAMSILSDALQDFQDLSEATRDQRAYTGGRGSTPRSPWRADDPDLPSGSGGATPTLAAEAEARLSGTGSARVGAEGGMGGPSALAPGHGTYADAARGGSNNGRQVSIGDRVPSVPGDGRASNGAAADASVLGGDSGRSLHLLGPASHSGDAHRSGLQHQMSITPPSSNLLLEKLLSPDRRKRDPEETKRNLEAKHARARKARLDIQRERLEKLARVEESRALAKQRAEEPRGPDPESLQGRIQRSEGLRAAHLEEIQRKARSETLKVNEAVEASRAAEEQRRTAIQERYALAEQRRQERLLDIKRKQREAEGREQEARERRLAREQERLARLEESQARKELAQVKVEQERRAAMAALEARKTQQRALLENIQREQQDARARLEERLRVAEARRQMHLNQVRERASITGPAQPTTPTGASQASAAATPETGATGASSAGGAGVGSPHRRTLSFEAQERAIEAAGGPAALEDRDRLGDAPPDDRGGGQIRPVSAPQASGLGPGRSPGPAFPPGGDLSSSYVGQIRSVDGSFFTARSFRARKEGLRKRARKVIQRMALISIGLEEPPWVRTLLDTAPGAARVAEAAHLNEAVRALLDRAPLRKKSLLITRTSGDRPASASASASGTAGPGGDQGSGVVLNGAPWIPRPASGQGPRTPDLRPEAWGSPGTSMSGSFNLWLGNQKMSDVRSVASPPPIALPSPSQPITFKSRLRSTAGAFVPVSGPLPETKPSSSGTAGRGRPPLAPSPPPLPLPSSPVNPDALASSLWTFFVKGDATAWHAGRVTGLLESLLQLCGMLSGLGLTPRTSVLLVESALAALGSEMNMVHSQASRVSPAIVSSTVDLLDECLRSDSILFPSTQPGGQSTATTPRGDGGGGGGGGAARMFDAAALDAEEEAATTRRLLELLLALSARVLELPAALASEEAGVLHDLAVAFGLASGIIHKIHDLLTLLDRPHGELEIPSYVEQSLRVLEALTGPPTSTALLQPAPARSARRPGRGQGDGGGSSSSEEEAAAGAPIHQNVSGVLVFFQETSLVRLTSMLTSLLLQSQAAASVNASSAASGAAAGPGSTPISSPGKQPQPLQASVRSPGVPVSPTQQNRPPLGLGSQAPEAPGLPPNFAEVATRALRVLNRAAGLRLTAFQDIAGAPDLRIEVYLIVHSLLGLCSQNLEAGSAAAAADDPAVAQWTGLLREVMLLAGNFVLQRPSHHQSVQWGKTPTILQILSALSSIFMKRRQQAPKASPSHLNPSSQSPAVVGAAVNPVDPDMRLLLCTLVACCLGSDRNALLLQGEYERGRGAVSCSHIRDFVRGLLAAVGEGADESGATVDEALPGAMVPLLGRVPLRDLARGMRSIANIRI